MNSYIFVSYSNWWVWFVIVLLCIFVSKCTLTTQSAPFDVTNFGALGDGKSDDTAAFNKAWMATCNDKGLNSTMLVTAGKTFLLQSLQFKGPCSSSSITFKISGNIIAPSKNSFKSKKKFKTTSDKWIEFANVNGLVINGIGNFDGSATINDWWKPPNIATGPSVLALSSCTNVNVDGPTFLRPPRSHITINGCINVTISNIQINAPENSPNTDGIDIASSTNISISDSNIQTGDDCVAINSGSFKINMTRVNCGPGHGISVGSLGRSAANVEIAENVHVKNCTFTRTMNGARIKTWNGNIGYAGKISYEDIILVDVMNPIIIDQNYCPDKKCVNSPSKVKISDVSFKGFKGTTLTNVAVKFDCSSKIPCQNIQVADINITAAVSLKQPVISICKNAFGISSPLNIPNVTLSPTLLAFR